MPVSFKPSKSQSWDPLGLRQLQRIKRWQVDHQSTHPVEYLIWEVVLTLWVMGWIGGLPAFELEVPWAYPLCLLGILSPKLYVSWRARAHAAGHLKCDWLTPVD
jgi:hypothetical protein